MKVSELKRVESVQEFRNTLLKILVSNEQNRTIKVLTEKGQKDVEVDELNNMDDLTNKYGIDLKITPKVNPKFINNENYIGDLIDQIEIIDQNEFLNKFNPVWVSPYHNRFNEIFFGVIKDYRYKKTD